MQYAVSDIHGRYDKYAELLRRIDLKPFDTMYVLGDMIDRGPDGLKILRDIAMRPNIVPFLGNHEYAGLAALALVLSGIVCSDLVAFSEYTLLFLPKVHPIWSRNSSPFSFPFPHPWTVYHNFTNLWISS